jgi:hypothetical protein
MQGVVNLEYPRNRRLGIVQDLTSAINRDNLVSKDGQITR